MLSHDISKCLPETVQMKAMSVVSVMHCKLVTTYLSLLFMLSPDNSEHMSIGSQLFSVQTWCCCLIVEVGDSALISTLISLKFLWKQAYFMRTH